MCDICMDEAIERIKNEKITEQYSCVKCYTDIDADDVVWADVYGNLTTMTGYPYCASCLPEELNYDY